MVGVDAAPGLDGVGQPRTGPSTQTDSQPSVGQERLWFMEQFMPGTAAYVVSASIRLRGSLDVQLLQTALDVVVARHDSLRVAFPSLLDGRPTMRTSPAARIPLQLAQGDDLEHARRQIIEAVHVPFDLAVAPLARSLLVRLASDDHVLHLAMHHIVSDGWSMDLLLRDVAAQYAALRDGQPAPESPQMSYSTFAAWQRARLDGPEAATELDYWRNALRDVPPLDLPTDRPRAPERSLAGSVVRFELDPQLVAGLRQLSRTYRTSLYMALLTGFQAVLFRYTGQRDFAVGTPVAGRVTPQLEDVIGLFTNTLAVRADVSRADAGEPSFATLLTRVRSSVLQALSHQETPFERLVQELNVTRDVSRTPVFQVLFALQNYVRGAGRWPADITVEGVSADRRTARFDLSLYLTETGEAIQGTLLYSSALFNEASVQHLVRHYRALLAAAVATPEAPLVDLDLLDPAERAQILTNGSGREGGRQTRHCAPESEASDRSTSATLVDLIAPHVTGTPDAPAIVCGEQVLTYGQLDRRANQLSRYLRACGVTVESRVGVCLEQSTDMAVALLAVLRCGAAYLPLDPEQPSGRLATMLLDAKPAIVITSDALAAQLPVEGRSAILRLEEAAQEIQAESDAPVRRVALPQNLAYIIYTSGSTGVPKGVAVAHQQVVNYLEGVAERLKVVPGSRYALLQSLSFDFSVTMFYLALATGGCVHLIPRRCSGAELADQIERHRIDYLKMTPSHLAALAADTEPGSLLPARVLLLGGEAAGQDWAADLAQGTAGVVNHYGPTEATVGVTTHQIRAVDRGPGMVPIGRPLLHARVYVLDERLRPTPAGVPGEIYLGGDRLARGYLGRPGLTAERFVPDPFAGTDPITGRRTGPVGGRMYRTGDIGRWNADGRLEFLGRRDDQIKLRGYRVELGEVETALRTCPGVVQAVVLLRGDRLVAYLEQESGAQPSEPAQLRQTLADRLPDYMIPNQYVWMDRLPLQDHGKVDRRALPEPSDERSADSYVPPSGPVEAAIAEAYASALGLAQVGATDDFFDLGGHSLLATQVIARLRRELPAAGATTQAAAVGAAGLQPLSVMDLFRHRTVRQLAAAAGATAETGPDERPAPEFLFELTAPVDPAQTVRSLVCVPYGGGSAVVYQPLAQVLPAGHRLFAVAVPGHDVGLGGVPEPIETLAPRVAEEVLATVTGPVVIYGHCGPGAALAVEVARLVEAAGRAVDAVYLGGIFPFARPTGGLFAPLLRLRERLRSDHVYRTWLQAAGSDIAALETEQANFLIRAMRHDALISERYFSSLLHRQVRPLRAPIISVVGERDRGTEYYLERYREWHFLSDRTALAVIDEGGHYFLKYRATELAEIVSTVDGRVVNAERSVDFEVATEPVDDTELLPAWQLAGISVATTAAESGTDGEDGLGARAHPQPSLRTFSLIAAGQLATMTGTALTNFAIPLWIYLETGSLVRFAFFALVGLIPGLLVAPLTGALVDRISRRSILIAASGAAVTAETVVTALLITDRMQVTYIYVLVGWLSVALAFQRIAFTSAVPQLVPKRYLGHANGVVQMATSLTQFLVPLIAVVVMQAIGLRGILLLDVASYAIAITILSRVRFPNTMALRRRESIGAEIVGGWRLSFQRREFRAMLIFFAALNTFLFPVLYLLSPLVLGFAKLANVAQVATVGALGGALGGLVMLLWGGPRRLRMRGVLLGTLFLAVFCALIGLRPSLAVVSTGVFGLYLSLAVVNGIYATIVQTKIPQRFHGRVFALNQMVAWSTLPLGWGLIAPLASEAAEPLLRPGGALASTVGVVIGVGPGRGIGLIYLVFGVCIALVAAISLRTEVLAGFDDNVRDALPDDVIGLHERQARAARNATSERQGASNG